MGLGGLDGVHVPLAEYGLPGLAGRLDGGGFDGLHGLLHRLHRARDTHRPAPVVVPPAQVGEDRRTAAETAAVIPPALGLEEGHAILPIPDGQIGVTAGTLRCDHGLTAPRRDLCRVNPGQSGEDAGLPVARHGVAFPTIPRLPGLGGHG